jgi:hypothetical protein
MREQGCVTDCGRKSSIAEDFMVALPRTADQWHNKAAKPVYRK